MNPRISAILLIFALIAPIAGIQCLLHIQKWEIKREIKWQIAKGVDRSDLVHLGFHNSEVEYKLDWKHSKEFSFEGEMYDIVYSESRNDSVFYWCWWDEEETILNKRLTDLTFFSLQHQPERQKSQVQLIRLLHVLFLPPTQFEKECFKDPKRVRVQCKKRFYQSAKLKIPTPPPKADVFI